MRLKSVISRCVKVSWVACGFMLVMTPPAQAGSGNSWRQKCSLSASSRSLHAGSSGHNCFLWMKRKSTKILPEVRREDRSHAVHHTVNPKDMKNFSTQTAAPNALYISPVNRSAEQGTRVMSDIGFRPNRPLNRTPGWDTATRFPGASDEARQGYASSEVMHRTMHEFLNPEKPTSRPKIKIP